MLNPTSDGTRPRFSIVIPAYNEECYIGACLSSLARQDFAGSFEVIVVDNNSSDATAAVARTAGATVVFEAARGVCQARQRGTESASGTFIVSADADTLYAPDWLSTIDRWFGRNPDAVAVGGPCYFHDGPSWGRRLQKLLFGGVSLVQRLGGPVLYITATNFAFRSADFPGYDARLTQGGDELDLLRKLRRRGRVAFDPGNAATTSARRMEKGVVYNFAVSFFYYYIVAYALNRAFGRPVLGTAPAFRRAPAAAISPPGDRESAGRDGRDRR